MLYILKHYMRQTSAHLQNFFKHRIPTLGCFQMDIQHQGKQAHVTIYTTAYGISPLGLDAIQKLRFLINDATLMCYPATRISLQLPCGSLRHVKDCVH